VPDLGYEVTDLRRAVSNPSGGFTNLVPVFTILARGFTDPAVN
jgi:hypothetical protein